MESILKNKYVNDIIKSLENEFTVHILNKNNISDGLANIYNKNKNNVKNLEEFKRDLYILNEYIKNSTANKDKSKSFVLSYISKNNYVVNIDIIYLYECKLENVFHELSHALQYSKFGIIKTVSNKKQKLLYNYKTETQADLFSYLLLILTENKNINEILYKSAIGNYKKGHFSFPILYDIMENQKTILYSFKENNEINFIKLFEFTIQETINKTKVYADFLLKKEINMDTFINYLYNNNKNKYPNIYKNSKIELDIIKTKTFIKKYENSLQKANNNLDKNNEFSI